MSQPVSPGAHVPAQLPLGASQVASVHALPGVTTPFTHVHGVLVTASQPTCPAVQQLAASHGGAPASPEASLP